MGARREGQQTPAAGLAGPHNFGFHPSESTTYAIPGDCVRFIPGLEWDLVLHPGNPMAISATKLRADLYRLIDNVILTPTERVT